MEEFLASLRRRALGYSEDEEVIEETVDSEGRATTVKRKTVNKHYPPDVTALKTYIELSGGDNRFSSMTDEQLLSEREKLVRGL